LNFDIWHSYLQRLTFPPFPTAALHDRSTAAPQHCNTAEPQFRQSSFSEFVRAWIFVVHNRLLQESEETPGNFSLTFIIFFSIFVHKMNVHEMNADYLLRTQHNQKAFLFVAIVG